MMKGLRGYLTRRVLGYLVVAATIALLSFAGIGRVQAQDYSACTTNSRTGECATAVQANSEAERVANYLMSVFYNNGNYVVCAGLSSPGSDGVKGSKVWNIHGFSCADGVVDSAMRTHPYEAPVEECPNGYGRDPFTNICLDENSCRARNVGLGLNPPRSSMTTTRCPAGCEFKMTPETTDVVNGVTVYRGVMEYSGGPCGTVPIDPNFTEETVKTPPKQECIPVAGQSMCVKATGEKCYSASTGRQICWQQTETGEKTDETLKQKRDAGTSEIPPPLTLPNGDTLVKQGQSITTTTTNNTNNTTTITTTTNYTTTNGTNPAPDGGSGSGETGDGTDPVDEDGNKSTGGTNCESAPVSSGDALLAQIAHQQWLARCTASGELFDLDHGEGVVAGKTGWDESPGTAPVLDESGFGLGSSCPSPPVITLGGMTRTLDFAGLCDLGNIIAALVLLAAFAQAAYILAGNR